MQPHKFCDKLISMLVAIDTGGTKTLVSSFNKKGERGPVYRFPTPIDKRRYVNEVKTILQEKYSDKKVDAIVIALPGIINNNVATWCENLGWKNFNLPKELEGVLGKAPIIIQNDANLAGLAEARALNPIPTSVLYVTVSTGIGSGIITNGNIDIALSKSEAGRALIEYDGRVKEWEDFASGRAIALTYKKLARDIHSIRTWRQIADRISRGFLALIPILQPDIIIIGGSMGTHFDKYHTRLKELLVAKLPRNIPCPRIIKARHPEEAVIYGCYYYGIDYLSKK